MCWIIFLLRMMVKKREPVESEDAYTLANRDQDGYAEEELPVKEDPFEFGNLPVDLVCKVFSQLSYTDAIHLRNSSRQALSVYNKYRGQIKGPRVDAFVNIEGGRIVTRARPYRVLCGEGTLIPEEERAVFFRNADVALSLRFGLNNVTTRITLNILETFAKSNLESVIVKANTISQKTKDLVNSLKCLRVTLNIGRYDENVAEVANVKSLQIKHELMFFQLESIVRRGFDLHYLHATVTAAAIPRIMECISEWKANRRVIHSWYFLVPLVEILQMFGGIPLDWRRSICRKDDGTGRLLMQTHTIAPQIGDPVTYQSVNWLCM